MTINNLENFILEQLKVKVKLDVIDEHPNKDSSDQKEHEHQWDDVVCVNFDTSLRCDCIAVCWLFTGRDMLTNVFHFII